MPDTIQLRIFVLANAEGKWAAYGWAEANKDEADEVLYDMMSGTEVDTARCYVVTAEIPLPKPHEVVGVAGSAEET